jgi:hypothetical protein
VTSDAAKRVADQYGLHKIGAGNDSFGKWFAVKLHDGTSDGTLYDSKSDAIRHQSQFEQYYAFVQVGPWSMSPQDAETFLKINREAYEKGLRLADGSHKGGGRDIIRRVSREDQYAQLRSMFRGDIAPTNITHGGN